MDKQIFSPREREPSSLTGFSGNRIERQSENRADDSVEAALRHPDARLMILRDGRLYLDMDGTSAKAWHDRQEAAALKANEAEAVLLGTLGGAPLLAAPCDIVPDALDGTLKAIDYRSVYVQGLLSREDEGALAQAASLLSWNGTHRFCSRCGSPSRSASGGYKRICESCSAEHFPRTDPVAIMLAVHGERCLLGRSPHFAPGMYSCLAGFIEPGETIEDAVRRETFEESGIRVGRVTYHASQPWPFPHSLMIGCYGEAVSDEIDRSLTELEDCRWFSRDEVRTLNWDAPEGSLRIPPRGAIATRLIVDWANGAI